MRRFVAVVAGVLTLAVGATPIAEADDKPVGPRCAAGYKLVIQDDVLTCKGAKAVARTCSAGSITQGQGADFCLTKGTPPVAPLDACPAGSEVSVDRLHVIPPSSGPKVIDACMVPDYQAPK